MIYLDNAATTKVHPAVLDAMVPYLSDKYGNPSANYDFGSDGKEAIENARHIIAESINAADDEIYFTSGGTEADNTVVKMLVNQVVGVVTTPIEHKAILNSIQNNLVEYVKVLPSGIVDIDSFKKMSLFNRLVTIMYANNETGVVQPIKEIGEYIDSYFDLRWTIFHTDAVQAYCHIPIDVKKEHIDMLSASAHKFNGPKGVGFLYISKDVAINPFITGGGQERGFRSGTENVASIVGMGKAVEIAMVNLEKNIEKVSYFRDYFEDKILHTIDGVHINGDEPRLPGHCNIMIEKTNAEEILEFLNSYQIYASSGSACSAKDMSPSYVLKAMGRTNEQANSSLRFSIGQDNTVEELDYVVDTLASAVKLFRHMP